MENIYWLFHILAQVPFTTSERELDHYHQKVNIQVASRGSEQLKTFEILENYEGSSKSLKFLGKYSAFYPKGKF